MTSVLFTAVVGLLSLTLFWAARSTYVQRARARQHGCAAVPRRASRDPLFGVDLKWHDIKAMRDMNALPAAKALHRRFGSTYGETSLFGLTLKTADPDNLQTIFGLRARDWGVGPFRYEGMRPFCGAGLLSTDGPIWEHSRAMFKPSFLKRNIEDLSQFEAMVVQFLDQLPMDGTLVDLDDSLDALFVDSATNFILGQPLGALTQSEPENVPVTTPTFLSEFKVSQQMVGVCMLLGPLRIFVPKSATTKHWKVVHRFVDFFVNRALEKGPSDKMTTKGHSLMDSLLEQTKDRLELRNQALQGLMGAFDTTALLVSNTIHLLARHPEIWARFRAEAATISSEPLTIQESRKSKLLRNILRESLRLYPVFALLARDTVVDTILPTGGGPKRDLPIWAPAGTRVVGDFWTLHRDESVFGSDPETFNPDRWDTIEPSAWQYMPFGGGMRQCLGQYKALGEASCCLIRMAQRIDKLVPRDDRPWAGDLQLVARNVNGCKVGLFVTKA